MIYISTVFERCLFVCTVYIYHLPHWIHEKLFGKKHETWYAEPPVRLQDEPLVSLGIYSMTRYPFGQKIEVPHWTLLPSSKLSDAKLETEQCRIDKWHKCKGRDYRIGVLYDLKRLNQVEQIGRAHV